MLGNQDVNATVRAMQIAVAPVFLISGIGVLLGTMTARYGRVIDRVRAILAGVHHQDAAKEVDFELRALFGRARLLRATIIFAAASIFCVALTVFVLFSDLEFGTTFHGLAEWSFVAALVLLIVAICMLIQDFAISLRILKLEVRTKLRRNWEETPLRGWE